MNAQPCWAQQAVAQQNMPLWHDNALRAIIAPSGSEPDMRLRINRKKALALVFNKDEGVLLGEQQYSPLGQLKKSRKLVFPGGGIEKGETVHKAAWRELREEAGLLVSEEEKRKVARCPAAPLAEIFEFAGTGWLQQHTFTHVNVDHIPHPLPDTKELHYLKFYLPHELVEQQEDLALTIRLFLFMTGLKGITLPEVPGRKMEITGSNAGVAWLWD